MADRVQVAALDEHNYVVRVGEGESTIEFCVHTSPEVTGLLPAGTDELQLVEATAAYLIERQRADDLPATVDLDDVVAAYDGYLDEIITRLATATGTGR